MKKYKLKCTWTVMTAMEYKRQFFGIPETVPDRLVGAYIANYWKAIIKEYRKQCAEGEI